MGSGTAVGWRNLADEATIAATSEAGDLTAAKLQDPVLANKWRSGPGSSHHLQIDFGAPTPISMLGVLGHNLGSTGGAPSWTIAGSTVAMGAADVLNLGASATGIYADTRPAAKRFGQPNGQAWRSFASCSPRYLDILLSDASLTYLQAGRLVLLLPVELTHAFTYGAGRGRDDLRDAGESKGGQLYVGRGARRRRERFQLTFRRDLDEEWSIADAMDADNGQSDDVMICLNTAAANLNRVTLWGPVASQSEITMQNVKLCRREYTVVERL